MTAPTPEKAAPIPALLPCPFCGGAASVRPDEVGIGGQHVGPYWAGCPMPWGCGVVFQGDDPEAAAEVWNRRADREARPSLPDSREERIRAEAAEDERDRLFALIDGDGFANSGARSWFREQGAMHPAERARTFEYRDGLRWAAIMHEAADRIAALEENAAELDAIASSAFTEMPDGASISWEELYEAERSTALHLRSRIAALEAEASEAGCMCRGVEIGSHMASVSLPIPEHMADYRESRVAAGLSPLISVDACLVVELRLLWARGIRTYGSCCGHNKVRGMINVHEDDTAAMLAMGYEQWPEKDGMAVATFYPKSARGLASEGERLRAALRLIRLTDWSWPGGGSLTRVPGAQSRTASHALGLPEELPEGWPSDAEYEDIRRCGRALVPPPPSQDREPDSQRGAK